MTVDELNQLREKHNGSQRKPPAHNESKLQIACINWFHLQYPKHLIYSVPNGGFRNKVEAKIMRAEGIISGIPDLCIPVPRKGYHGLYIEMKFGKNKLSDNQIQIIAKLEAEGYKCDVCYSLEQFMNSVNTYFKEHDNNRNYKSDRS